VVANIDGFEVTTDHAFVLRSRIMPPPATASATRLAYEAALAYWDGHGTLQGSAPAEWLDTYRRFRFEHERSAEAVAALIDVARRAGVKKGPCHVES
jgi:hypothetical protein